MAMVTLKGMPHRQARRQRKLQMMRQRKLPRKLQRKPQMHHPVTPTNPESMVEVTQRDAKFFGLPSMVSSA
eukprot:8109327-Prorocentrum_lima.AAC.1